MPVIVFSSLPLQVTTGYHPLPSEFILPCSKNAQKSTIYIFLADNLMYIPGGPVRFMGYGATKKSDPSVENVK